MDWLLLAKAAIMGIVEGLTEFFPISSTGHLIVVGDLINFDDRIGNVFEVVIQLGAILAVCWEYRARLWQVAIDLPTKDGGRQLLVPWCPPLARLGPRRPAPTAAAAAAAPPRWAAALAPLTPLPGGAR